MTTTTQMLTPVAADTAETTVPLLYLQSLPEGATYTAHHGRAGIKLTKRGNAIEATATVDSMGREIYKQEQAINSLTRLTNKMLDQSKDSLATTEKKKSSGIPPLLGWAGVAAIMGAIILIATIFKKKGL